MKKIFALPFLMMSTLIGLAQPGQVQEKDSWKICLNKVIVLASSKSDELINIKKIKPTEWKKNGYLEVSFKEANPSNWIHSIQFADQTGNPLLIKDSVTTTKISLVSLRKLFKGKKEIKIFMIINPPNPMIMAPSRIFHLVTLRLP